MESFEVQGLWWLPSDKENKVPGMLRFDPVQGTKLQLLGSLTLKEAHLTRTNDLIPYTDIIIGKTPSEKFTLYRCHENESGIKKSGFDVDFIFKNYHFYEKKDITFNRVTLTYPNLNKWANLPATYWLSANSNEISDDKFFFKKNEDIIANINKFIIILSFTQLPIPKIPNELDLVQNCHITIKFNEKAHFYEYKDKWAILQDFLTFGIGKAVSPLSITGYINSDNDVKIFYNVNSIIPPIEDIPQKDMLFFYSNISDGFEKYLNNWFNNAKRFGPFYDLYFGTFRMPSMFLEHRFLSYIQAIEAYHSRLCPEKSKKKREWSLRKRLENIFLKYGDLLNLLIQDSDNFIDEIVKTRNYYTHYSEDLEKKVITDVNQGLTNIEKLKFIIEVCLLAEAGINTEQLKKIMFQYNNYKDLRTLKKNHESKSCSTHMGVLLLEKLLNEKTSE